MDTDSHHRYIFTDEENETWNARLTERLRALNVEYLPADNDRVPLEIYVRDDDGTVVGGLIGRTVWGWLEIAVLWVDEQLRGKGLGSELMKRGEHEARRRGCVVARLSTWDFQALSLYKRLGYVPYGMLEDYPPGHTVYYLRKGLTEAQGATP